MFRVAAKRNSPLSICRYYSHNNDYLEICRCYKAIYDIPSIKEDPVKWTPVFSHPRTYGKQTHLSNHLMA
jgi:hypothetical protein